MRDNESLGRIKFMLNGFERLQYNTNTVYTSAAIANYKKMLNSMLASNTITSDEYDLVLRILGIQSTNYIKINVTNLKLESLKLVMSQVEMSIQKGTSEKDIVEQLKVANKSGVITNSIYRYIIELYKFNEKLTDGNRSINERNRVKDDRNIIDKRDNISLIKNRTTMDKNRTIRDKNRISGYVSSTEMLHDYTLLLMDYIGRGGKNFIQEYIKYAVKLMQNVEASKVILEFIEPFVKYIDNKSISNMGLEVHKSRILEPNSNTKVRCSDINNIKAIIILAWLQADIKRGCKAINEMYSKKPVEAFYSFAYIEYEIKNPDPCYRGPSTRHVEYTLSSDCDDRIDKIVYRVKNNDPCSRRGDSYYSLKSLVELMYREVLRNNGIVKSPCI